MNREATDRRSWVAALVMTALAVGTMLTAVGVEGTKTCLEAAVIGVAVAELLTAARSGVSGARSGPGPRGERGLALVPILVSFGVVGSVVAVLMQMLGIKVTSLCIESVVVALGVAQLLSIWRRRQLRNRRHEPALVDAPEDYGGDDDDGDDQVMRGAA